MGILLWNQLEHLEWALTGANKEYPPIGLREALKRGKQQAEEDAKPKKTAADIRARIAENESRN